MCSPFKGASAPRLLSRLPVRVSIRFYLPALPARPSIKSKYTRSRSTKRRHCPEEHRCGTAETRTYRRRVATSDLFALRCRGLKPPYLLLDLRPPPRRTINPPSHGSHRVSATYLSTISPTPSQMPTPNGQCNCFVGYKCNFNISFDSLKCKLKPRVGYTKQYEKT